MELWWWCNCPRLTGTTTARGGGSRCPRRSVEVADASLAMIVTAMLLLLLMMLLLRRILPIHVRSATSSRHTPRTANTTNNAAIFIVLMIVIMIVIAVVLASGYECIQRVVGQ